ncbi:hypothetical protein PYW08_014201 [Mythimna loreyi]|uniref:Uncharacterized protein n=1 Tax=Mythimna loreyi TaxID=667449 RepID=A0ACC2R759_9NEOP|nr:hypothetical protein PYW08_014201 [Mythimna loreyi]
MSSTTSSDCESCDCSQCTYSFDNDRNEYGKLVTNSRHVPIYATMAHPLIYYAQVQQPKNRRQANDLPRKDNPFKKAFKWYTQERGRMLSNKPEICPERSGFASWLDDKYDEYLREGGQPGKLATTLDSRTLRDSMDRDTCTGASKKYRLKGPWSNRRSVNDGGDVPEKGPCGSCEYILKPKDLTRATSEHTPTSGGKSNATVTSINMPCNIKCSGRSHSLSDVGHEKSVSRCVETVTHIVCGPKAQEQTTPTITCTCPREQEVPIPPKIQEPKVQEQKIQKPKIHCKCPRCLCPPDEVPEEPEKGLSKEIVQPCCPCPQKKTSQIKKPPSKINPPTPPSTVQSKEKIPEVVKQDPPRLPYCPCPQDKVPQVVKLPSRTQEPTYPPVCPSVQVQETKPETEKVQSKAQDHKYPPLPQQVSELVKVPSKAQETKKQPKPSHEKLPEVVKVPSKGQKPTDQPGPCCKCHLKKVPEVVQVPSHSRAVQESCQVPEDKIIPVNEGTQYEPALRSARSTHPCCCNACNPPFPPSSQIICLPVKVQSSKISSPENYLVTSSTGYDTPKKQKKTTQKRSVSCQFDEGSKSKVDTQCEQQTEPCICSKPCCNNCHSFVTVGEPTPIRRQSHSTVAISEETGENALVREVAVVNKLTRSVTCASNDAAQTSDHSICFDKDGVCSCQCPLFLKIIYADIKE